MERFIHGIETGHRETDSVVRFCLCRRQEAQIKRGDGKTCNNSNGEARVVKGIDRKIFGFSIYNADAKSIARSVCGQRPSGIGLVVTPNLDHVVNLRHNVEFANAYKMASIIVCDGFPVQYYARLRGIPVKRVTGCDIMNELMYEASDILSGQRLFFAVDSDQTATSVKHWGNIRGVAVETSVPPLGFENNFDESERLLDEITKHRTTILVMGVGAPKSEVWVWRHQHELPICWVLCVGQAVRVALGLTTKAPKLIRTLHGEWLWRICQEPHRLAGRYIRGSVMFPLAVFRDLLETKGRRSSAETKIATRNG